MILTSREQRLLDIAVQVAQCSGCKQKHGAVIYKGGRILAQAANRRVTHPESLRWAVDPKKITTIHAEQRAIILARTDLKGSTLVSVRLNGNRCSKPCVMCAALMRDAGIAYVIYFNGIEHVKERL